MKAMHYLAEQEPDSVKEFEQEEPLRPDYNTYAEISEPEPSIDINLHVKAANNRAGLDVDTHLEGPTSVEFAVPSKLYAYIADEIDALTACGEQTPFRSRTSRAHSKHRQIPGGPHERNPRKMLHSQQEGSDRTGYKSAYPRGADQAPRRSGRSDVRRTHDVA